MNREIKFRGYCEKDSEWRHGFYITNGVIHEINTLLDCGSFYASQIEPETVGQYIGLKDIDGCEICESDVCEIMYYTPFGDKTNEFYGNWVVKKWMGMFVLVSGKERLLFTDFANVTKTEYVPNLGTVAEFSDKVNVRVIGNIHENPELLEK